MPQFPIIPLKGYIYHAPTRQAGIAPYVPLCPEVEGQGNRDTPPHTRARTLFFRLTDIFFWGLGRAKTIYLVKPATLYLVKPMTLYLVKGLWQKNGRYGKPDTWSKQARLE